MTSETLQWIAIVAGFGWVVLLATRFVIWMMEYDWHVRRAPWSTLEEE